MNTPNSEIKRWGIIVIQSLNHSDVKTGEILYHDILQYKYLIKRESFSYFYNVNSSDEFCLAMQTIEKSLSEGDIVTLQIETHGCNEGIGVNNGEIITWNDFYDIIRPINIKTGHLLFVVMAMCNSISVISAINPQKRAPYRAFICTTREVSADEILRGFIAFYDNFFNMLDIAQAINALQEEVTDINGQSPFQVLSAENVFDETFNPDRDITEIVDYQLERLNMPRTDTNITQMSNNIRLLLKAIHDRYYQYYNFKDIF